MATYSEDGHLVSCEAEREAMSPLAALAAAMAEQDRRAEQGIHLLPQGRK